MAFIKFSEIPNSNDVKSSLLKIQSLATQVWSWRKGWEVWTSRLGALIYTNQAPGEVLEASCHISSEFICCISW